MRTGTVNTHGFAAIVRGELIAATANMEGTSCKLAQKHDHGFANIVGVLMHAGDRINVDLQ